MPSRPHPRPPVRFAPRPTCAVAVVAWLMLPAPAVHGQIVRPDFPVTDGVVHCVAEAGGVLYLGGSFTRVGPATGAAAVIDSATGATLGAPRVSGAYRADWSSVGARGPVSAGIYFVRLRAGAETVTGRVILLR